jgi:hypothetical protein
MKRRAVIIILSDEAFWKGRCQNLKNVGRDTVGASVMKWQPAIADNPADNFSSCLDNIADDICGRVIELIYIRWSGVAAIPRLSR